MLRANQLALGGLPALTPLALTYQASYSYGSSHASRSFTGCPIGAPSPKRYVAVAAMSLDISDRVTDLTVGGAACTELAGFDAGLGATSIWITNEPVLAGTTATIAVTYSGSVSSSAISVYTIEGTPDLTPFDTVVVQSSNAALGAQSIDVVAGGVVIVAASNNGDNLTCAWTGLTENYDAYVATATYSSASQSFDTYGTQSITAAWSISTGDERFIAVSLKPSG